MNIEQAEKQLAKFTSEKINGSVSVHNVIEFCIDFLDLMDKQKVSPGNSALFANISTSFIWSGNYLKTFDTFEIITQKFIDKMKSDK